MIKKHTGTDETTISYTDILSNWRALEGAFQLRLGIDLQEVWQSRSWRWFSTRVAILLADDNPFSRLVLPEPQPQQGQEAELNKG